MPNLVNSLLYANNQNLKIITDFFKIQLKICLYKESMLY